MSYSDIGSEILEFIRTEAEVPDDDPDFGPDVDLFDLGYVDSFMIVRLIAMVQDRFGVDLGNEDFYADALRTAAGIAAFVQRRRASP